MLSTRTTVIGATNPKGAFDPLAQLGGFASLSSPLLSRFDIVLLLRDSRQPAWDRVVSSQVLANHAQRCEQGGGEGEEEEEDGEAGEGPGADSCAAPDQGPPAAQPCGWTIDTLQKYFVWVKGAFQPVLTPEAEALLVAYYQSLRQAQDRSAARTTIRMLESLIRVAQVGAQAGAWAA